MTVLADYSQEEQQVLLRSLEAAGIAVSAASLGRKAETASEGFAAASYILEHREEYLTNTLIGSVQFALQQRAESGQKFPDYAKLAEAPGAEAQALDTLRQAVAILDAKSTPAEASGYKHWLMNIAVTTSEAGKEGGNFLGWGAVAVSDTEKAVLERNCPGARYPKLSKRRRGRAWPPKGEALREINTIPTITYSNRAFIFELYML
ncbi:MAG: hypothetical protein IPK16_17365 [Anaerolineales bacterium]|nr:hypothetical protein [Anaerolineales bacterium]